MAVVTWSSFSELSQSLLVDFCGGCYLLLLVMGGKQSQLLLCPTKVSVGIASLEWSLTIIDYFHLIADQKCPMIFVREISDNIVPVF